MTTYTCQCCYKKYKRKSAYDRHCIWCTDTKDRERKVEEIEDCPPVEKMYLMIMDLSVKFNKLEAKYNKLLLKQEKETTTTLFDNVKPTISFKEWCQTITIDETHVAYILNNNVVMGLANIIQNQIQNQTHQLPIMITKNIFITQLREKTQ